MNIFKQGNINVKIRVFRKFHSETLHFYPRLLSVSIEKLFYSLTLKVNVCNDIFCSVCHMLFILKFSRQ